jgi:toxin FitB
MYLLDTNVVSEAVKPQPDTKVLQWLQTNSPSHFYISALSIGELEQGIVRSPSPNRAKELRNWLETSLKPGFRNRILGIDELVMTTWGRITGEALNKGRPASFLDSLLTATAITYQFTLVTRNVKDVSMFSLNVFNPWE